MFSRSTSQRFDFTPTSDTPGPGSYDVAASTLLQPNPHSSKKPTFGDSKRWTDIEALINRSNPLLLAPQCAATTATSDRKRLRESVAGGVGVRRMTVSSQGKRQRGDDEDGGDGKKGDGSRERADWEVERQKHAETQRELLRRLKEIKDDWDGEKGGLQQRIEQLQQQSDERDKQIAATNETIAALTQHNDDNAKQLQCELQAAKSEKDAVSAQLLSLTAAHDAISQRAASQQQLIDRLEAAAAQHQADIELHIKLLSEERQWRQELETSISAVQAELDKLQAVQAETAQEAASKQAEIAELKATEAELNAELADSRTTIEELQGTVSGSNQRLVALQAEMDATIEQLRSQQQHCQQLEVSLQTLQSEHQQLNATAAQTAVQLAASQTKVHEMTDDNAALADELRCGAERAAALEEQLAQANDDMDALQQRMEDTVSTMQSSHASQLQQLQLMLQQQQAEHDNSAMQWRAEIEQKTASIATLQQQLEAEQRVRTQLEQTAAEVDGELKITRSLQAESAELAAEKQTHIDALMAAAAQLNAQLVNNAEIIAALNAQLHQSQARFAALQAEMDTTVQQLRAQHDSAQAAWQADREQQLCTISSLEQQLAGQQHSTQQLETAISAVRADLQSLQHVQTETTQHSAARQAEIERLTGVEAQLMSDLSSTRSAAATLELQLNDSNARLVALQQEMDATVQRLRTEHQHAVGTLDSAMQAERQQQSAALSELRASLAASQSTVCTVNADIEQLRTSKANAEAEWQAERHEHVSNVAALSQQLSNQQQTSEQLEAEIAAVQAELQSMRALQARTATEAAEKQSHIEQLTAAAAALQTELDNSKSSAATLEAQLSAAQSAIASLTQDNTQLRSAVSELQLGTEAQQQVLASLRVDGKQKGEEAERLRGELAGVRNELVNLYTHHSDQTVEYRERCKEIDAIKHKLAEKDDSLQLMQKEHVRLIDDYAAAKLDTRQSREQVEQLMAQLSSLQQHVAQVTQQKEECLAEKAGIEREIAALEAQYEDITSQQRTLAASHSTLQTDHAAALSQLQAEQATCASLRQQGEEAVAELMRVRERWAQRSDEVGRLGEAVRELEAMVAQRGEDVERAKRTEAELQSRLDELIVQQAEATQWKDKYESSRELCLLLKADSERKQQQIIATVDERKREEAKLNAALEKLDKQHSRDKEKHSTALKDEEERHKRELGTEKRRHVAEMARMTAEKDELNRSTNREISEYKRGNGDMQRRMEAAEAKLATMTATEARLLHEKMSAERRVKELTAAVNDKEKEMERLTATVKDQLTKQLVQPLQQTTTRQQARITELEATLAAQSTSLAQLHAVQSQFAAFKAEVVSMTANYDFNQGQLRALHSRNEELSAAMADMAGHVNERQRIHMHQMIKEENKTLKQQLEATQRQLMRHKKEVQRLGGATIDEDEGSSASERRRTHAPNKENGVDEPASGKDARAESRKKVGPRHRNALSSMN